MLSVKATQINCPLRRSSSDELVSWRWWLFGPATTLSSDTEPEHQDSESLLLVMIKVTPALRLQWFWSVPARVPACDLQMGFTVNQYKQQPVNASASWCPDESVRPDAGNSLWSHSEEFKQIQSFSSIIDEERRLMWASGCWTEKCRRV